MSRAEAHEKIVARIKAGEDLRARRIPDLAALETARNDYTRWDKFNVELLKRIFDSSTFADEYSFFGAKAGFVNIDGPRPLFEQVDALWADVRLKIDRLLSIDERLEPVPEPGGPVSSSRDANPVRVDSRKVFIVHGHDQAARETVARFIERLNLEPVILHEQANEGRTLIEKFEAHADVLFAVVLLTPDDVGAAIQQRDNLRPRARQNVILELGFFMGKIGRKGVCALYKEGVELPSDYVGIVYTELDAGGAWRIALARELKKAGMDVDLNLAV